jgi:hypothetical protein
MSGQVNTSGCSSSRPDSSSLSIGNAFCASPHAQGHSLFFFAKRPQQCPATINGIEIRFDGNLANLTTLHKAAGLNKHKPAEWLRQVDTTNFILELMRDLKCASQAQLVKTTKGRYGSTFAHWQIALAYAKYLSPEFHIAANKIIKRYIEEELDPSPATASASTSMTPTNPCSSHGM